MGMMDNLQSGRDADYGQNRDEGSANDPADEHDEPA
jgi:hypothetical protein